MERLRRVIPYLLPFPSDPASAAMHCAPAGHAPRSVSAPMISRSHCCWGTAASEITGIAHRSGGWVRDGFALFPPVFPRSSALSGRKPSCSSSPLSESALICSSFSPRRFICFVPSGSRVAEATLWWFSVHFIHFQTVFTCLGVWLHLILNN